MQPRAAIFKICIYLGVGIGREKSLISVLKFMKLRVGREVHREGTCTHMADSRCYMT